MNVTEISDPYTIFAKQIKKRNLTDKTEEEKIEIWNRAVKLFRHNLKHQYPELMALTINQDFLMQAGYYEEFWRELGIPTCQVDKHYNTLHAAAAEDYIESCFN